VKRIRGTKDKRLRGKEGERDKRKFAAEENFINKTKFFGLFAQKKRWGLTWKGRSAYV